MPVPASGLSHWDKPLGQAQPVPVGQADWDKLCLFWWDKHSLSQLGLGKVKRDLSLSHGTSHIPTLEAFPCPGTISIPPDGGCPSSTCPNLSHKVGLQGREKLYSQNQNQNLEKPEGLGLLSVTTSSVGRAQAHTGWRLVSVPFRLTLQTV